MKRKIKKKKKMKMKMKMKISATATNSSEEEEVQPPKFSMVLEPLIGIGQSEAPQKQITANIFAVTSVGMALVDRHKGTWRHFKLSGCWKNGRKPEVKRSPPCPFSDIGKK